MDTNLRKAISEEILRAALIECFNEEMTDLPTDEQLSKMDFSYSESFEARMEAMFRIEEQKDI